MNENSQAPATRGRRRFLVGAGGMVAAGVAGGWWYRQSECFQRASAFIASAASYAIDLVSIIESGLAELGLDRRWAKGKSVLLKPNLVEPSRQAPHINTHPNVVRAVAEVFRRWDAREVFVAEGQGHCRDAHFVLDESGLGEVLREDRLEFVDLNHDDVFIARNRLGMTRLPNLHLPKTLQRADLVVSLPKMKTHHWAVVTLSMKNLFGVIPGICYGWPKNVLHHRGIGQSIVDIVATVRPHLAIVDGIVGMDGDGPIMGDPKPAGVLVMGTNLPAVDATATRLMGLDPTAIDYLAFSSGRLGPIEPGHIEQRGASIASAATPFTLFRYSP
jgi:uncharacterized protein (DUF362 family)